MSQNIPVDGFKWIDTSLIDEKFNKFIGLIKNYDNYSNKGYNLSWQHKTITNNIF